MANEPGSGPEVDRPTTIGDLITKVVKATSERIHGTTMSEDDVAQVMMDEANRHLTPIVKGLTSQLIEIRRNVLGEVFEYGWNEGRGHERPTAAEIGKGIDKILNRYGLGAGVGSLVEFAAIIERDRDTAQAKFQSLAAVCNKHGYAGPLADVDAWLDEVLTALTAAAAKKPELRDPARPTVAVAKSVIADDSAPGLVKAVVQSITAQVGEAERVAPINVDAPWSTKVVESGKVDKASWKGATIGHVSREFEPLTGKQFDELVAYLRKLDVDEFRRRFGDFDFAQALFAKIDEAGGSLKRGVDELMKSIDFVDGEKRAPESLDVILFAVLTRLRKLREFEDAVHLRNNAVHELRHLLNVDRAAGTVPVLEAAIDRIKTIQKPIDDTFVSLLEDLGGLLTIPAAAGWNAILRAAIDKFKRPQFFQGVSDAIEVAVRFEREVRAVIAAHGFTEQGYPWDWIGHRLTQADRYDRVWHEAQSVQPKRATDQEVDLRPTIAAMIEAFDAIVAKLATEAVNPDVTLQRLIADLQEPGPFQSSDLANLIALAHSVDMAQVRRVVGEVVKPKTHVVDMVRLAVDQIKAAKTADDLWAMVTQMIERRYHHKRKRFVMADVDKEFIGSQLLIESAEFHAAAQAGIPNAKSELVDVLGIVVHAAVKLAVKPGELFKATAAKLEEVFEAPPLTKP